MKRIDWDPAENRELKSNPDRGICFEDVVAAIESGGLLDDVKHPNPEKFPSQRVLVVAMNEYIYAVPYVLTEEGMFLKTAFPSRRLKARYLNEGSSEKEPDK